MCLKIKTFLVICGLLAQSLSLFSQCPNKDSLWNRLIYLRDASTSTASEQLGELLSYENRIKSCPNKIDSTHAFLLERIGYAYYKRGDYLKTDYYFLHAVDMISANAGQPAINERHNIRFYYDLIIIYEDLNKIPEKIKAIDSCVAIAIRTKTVNIACLSAMYKKIEYLFYMGDYHNCIEYATMCEMLAIEYGRLGARENAIGSTYVLSSLGWRIISLIEIKDYKSAEEILTRKIREIKSGGEETYLGVYLEKLAEIEVNKGNYDQALLNFNQALASEQKAGHLIACKGILSNIGYFIYFNHFQDYNKTLFYYKKSLNFSKGSPGTITDPFESSSEMGNIGNVYAYLGKFDSAMLYFQYAFDQIKPGLNESILWHSSLDNFMKSKKNYYLTDLLINKGDAYISQYKLTKRNELISKSLLNYKVADKVLDRIKTDITELDSKLFWRSNFRRLYERAIEASYLEKSPVEAFYFFEKSRSVLLNDQLNQLSKISDLDIINLARVKKRKLQLDIDKDKSNSSAKQQAEFQTEVFSNNQELDRLEQTIKQNNPLYFQTFLDTSFIGLQDVQNRILKDHQALVEVFSGDSSVYTLTITRKQVYFNRINKTDFDSSSNAYSTYLANPGLLNSHYDDYIKISNHLYRLIFQNDSIPAGRIIISPDGKIFPFESLATNSDSRSPVYFLEDHAVSYTYSARYLLANFTNDTLKGSGDFLGVSPVVYSATFSLASLQGSDISLAHIGSYFDDSHNLVEAEASRSNFQKQFSNYNIIQLYTHASDHSSHGEPVIYFADSALYLSDLIPENKPQTRLIVLSACETGNGKFYQGEGVFNFNRGFASMGIPASIANLWPVDNKTTYQITELFYKYLAKGLPIDLALQKAKLEYIHRASKLNKLPYYWAASILAGKSDAISEGKKFPWKDILLVTGLTSLAFFVWQKRKKFTNENNV